MKFRLGIITIFSIGILSAQNEGVVNNQAHAFTAATLGANFAGTAYFKNPIKEIKGTVYLFDTWENSAVLVSMQNKRYLVKNVNINIQENTLQSKFSMDSLYTFNFSNIQSFVINNKIYKNIYDENGSKIYEIIYESDKFDILKGFHVKVIASSPNPMINRSNEKFSRKKGYYLRTGTTIKPFKLSKKRILKLLVNDKERIMRIEQYVESNKLSYKNEEQIREALEYSETR